MTRICLIPRNYRGHAHSALQTYAWQQTAEILAARWDKIQERNRPRYTPHQRFRILQLKHLFAWSRRKTARWFCLAPGTIARWEQRINASKDKGKDDGYTIGSLVKPEPPVRRYADVVRHLVQSMAAVRFGGSRRIAQTLVRAGWKISRRTVQRILKEKPHQHPETTAESATTADTETTPKPKPDRVVKAKRPNHVWMLDITDVPGMFRLLPFKLALVIDVFSRMPLAFRIFLKEPTAADIVALFDKAAAMSKAKPPHFISDQGSQFIAEPFMEHVKQFGVKQRFGAIGQYGSIAIIERLWRTLKDLLLPRVLPPLVQSELEQRVRLGLRYYAEHRPHQWLGGATPDELYLGKTPAHLNATPPPRAKPGKGPRGSPFEIKFLDPEQRFPLLNNKTA